MADLKERVVRLESLGVGASGARIEDQGNRAEAKQSTAQLLQTVGLFIVGLSVVIAIIALVLTHR